MVCCYIFVASYHLKHLTLLFYDILRNGTMSLPKRAQANAQKCYSNLMNPCRDVGKFHAMQHIQFYQKTTVQRVSILSSKCLDSCVPPLPPETACPGNAQDNESPALASQILSSLWNIEFQGHLIN